MTPGERERRIEAAAHAFAREIDCIPMPNTPAFEGFSRRAERILDAADKAVPMVPLADSPSGFSAGYLRQRERAECAEAAARDFAKALRDTAGYGIGAWPHIEKALARHPSFSGEEGTGP